jgi:hypothetical protein
MPPPGCLARPATQPSYLPRKRPKGARSEPQASGAGRNEAPHPD